MNIKVLLCILAFALRRQRRRKRLYSRVARHTEEMGVCGWRFNYFLTTRRLSVGAECLGSATRTKKQFDHTGCAANHLVFGL